MKFKQPVIIIACVCIAILFHFSFRATEKPNTIMEITKKLESRKNVNLIFIGGSRHSGSNLLLAMLDAHKDIECGHGSWIIHDIMERSKITNTKYFIPFLVQAGVYPVAENNANAQFILEIVRSHCPQLKNCCFSNLGVLLNCEFMRKLFPNSKFILITRDIRAYMHAEMRNGDTTNIQQYGKLAEEWVRLYITSYLSCIELGEEGCLTLSYEQLVLKPVSTTKLIFNFLGIPWSEEVLHHERYINKTSFLSSDKEPSRDLFKPLHINNVREWIGNVPYDLKRPDLDSSIYNAMILFGYDIENSSPDYGQPDDFMKKRMNEVAEL